ncbi:unnamed protein product [Soboliphyme baturini]|uniref:Uncharacterized protein n=1 Tax=Soboliphyme baturini TaxID=241478 RepID=A0A183J2N4_9BILA|nr:unnamed protein product [Soboliphyme baturini]
MNLVSPLQAADKWRHLLRIQERILLHQLSQKYQKIFKTDVEGFIDRSNLVVVIVESGRWSAMVMMSCLLTAALLAALTTLPRLDGKLTTPFDIAVHWRTWPSFAVNRAKQLIANHRVQIRRYSSLHENKVFAPPSAPPFDWRSSWLASRSSFASCSTLAVNHVEWPTVKLASNASYHLVIEASFCPTFDHRRLSMHRFQPAPSVPKIVDTRIRVP